VRVAEAADIPEDVSTQANPAEVLAIERETVAHGHATTRSERKILAHPRVLPHSLRNFVRSRCERRPNRPISDSETADPACRHHVAFEQRGRDRQRSSDVVESRKRLIGGKEGLGVDLQVEQLSDRVRILGPIQPMNDRPSRIGRKGCRLIERGFDGSHERLDARAVRPRQARGRHRAAAELPNDSFPGRRVLADMRGVYPVERETRSPSLLVVAGNTVGIQQRTIEWTIRRCVDRSAWTRPGKSQRDAEPADDPACRHLFTRNSS